MIDPVEPSRENGAISRSPGTLAHAACVLEVCAPKPGNVYPGRDFAHLSYLDFLLAAGAVARELDRARERSLGETVLAAVTASRSVTRDNANLGIVLLLSPLSSLHPNEEPSDGVARVLGALTERDTELVYEAIRVATPKGLGEADESDVRGDAPPRLLDAMKLAEDRDFIARQYVHGFDDIIQSGVPMLRESLDTTSSIEEAVVGLQLRLMAQFPDSHIARRCGREIAVRSSELANDVLEADWPETPESRTLEADLDVWLRDGGNVRNPGTTADCVAAVLFLGLRAGIIPIPLPRGNGGSSGHA
ncbi:MAG: triphosphoribosyl-dephospho-CoA synthase [Planctomycetota bacterium]